MDNNKLTIVNTFRINTISKYIYNTLSEYTVNVPPIYRYLF